MSNFLKSFSVFSSFTIISRALGFVRDIMNARVLGAGMLSDAFFVAFRLPNLFRSLFAEGAMNSAFIPIYSKKLIREEQDAPQFIGKIIFLTGLFSIVICVLAQIYMPSILNFIAPGFEKNNQYFDVGVTLSRIMFPFLFFITITAIYSCVLNSRGKFMPSAAYPIIMNVMMILASVFVFISPVYSISCSVTASGVLQMLFLMYITKHYGVKIGWPKFKFNQSNTLQKINTHRESNTLNTYFFDFFKNSYFFNDFFNYDVKHFFRKLLPSIMTSCVTRIGITIDTMIASHTIGAMSYIYYADRLYQLPLAVIGITLSTVLLPSLTKIITRIHQHRNDRVQHSQLIERLSLIQSRVFEFALILILPSTLGLFFLSNDISTLIFGSNNEQFHMRSILETGNFLRILCLALPANILNNIFNSILFANHITKFTTKAAVLTLTVNLTLNFVLYYKYNVGFKSVAIATVVSSYFNTICLGIFCKRKKFIYPSNDISRIRYIIFANMALVGIIEIINLIKEFLFTRYSWQWDVFLILEIGIIITVYFMMLIRKSKFRLNDFKGLFID